MKLHRMLCRLSLVLAVAAVAALPAFAQDATTATTTADQTQVFNLPTALPMGQGWYGAASTTTQNAMMAQGDAWSNNLTPVRGIGRVAVVDASPRPTGTMAASTDTQAAGTDRLVTGVAQWLNPSDNALYEVRFTGINSSGPLGGASVMRTMSGDAGTGFSQFPRSLNYVALDGPVQVMRNSQVIASDLQGHMMVTQGIRAPDSGRLLDTANVASNDIQMHLLVEGNIPGLNQNSLYVFWPQATLDLRNLSAPVALLPQEIQVAQSYFGISGEVAGYRGAETTGVAGALPAPMRLVMISLRDRFLARSTTQTYAGATELRIRNDSNEPRGFYIQGPGIDQRTNLLNPGEEISTQVTLQPGTYRLASFTTANPTTEDYMHWDEIAVLPGPVVSGAMGTTIQPDGNGTVPAPGTTIQPDGNGTVPAPGTTVQPDANGTAPAPGTTVQPDANGTAPAPGTTAQPDANGTAPAPMTPGATVITP